MTKKQLGAGERFVSFVLLGTIPFIGGVWAGTEAGQEVGGRH